MFARLVWCGRGAVLVLVLVFLPVDMMLSDRDWLLMLTQGSLRQGE